MLADTKPQLMLTNQSAANTTSAEIAINGADRVELGVDFKSGVTAGAVVLETAPLSGYGGLWNAIATITFSASAPKYMASMTDVAGHIARVRITTALVGGVCDVYVSRAIIGR